MGKRIAVRILAIASLALGLLAGSHRQAQAYTRISAGVEFYNALSPYGDWEYVPRYGECWVPADVSVGWRPYTVGYWVDTDYGWMWISQDPWGGIPYHYGRWTYDPYYGWVWVPDDDLVWAPAWVSWRYSDAYVGWAPLPPGAGWGGSGLTVSLSFVDREIPRSGWCFTPVRYFGTRQVRSYLLPTTRNVTVFASTRNVTRYTTFNSLPAERGLRPELIERATGRRFQRYQVVDSNRPNQLRRPAIRGQTIEAFRPRIVGAKSRASRFTEVRRAPERGAGGRQEMQQQRLERGREMNRQRLENARQDQFRRQREMQAQQERGARERRMQERRSRNMEQMQRDEGQGRVRNEGRWRDQGQTPDQGPGQDRGRGQGRYRERAPDQGQSQGQSPPPERGNRRARERQDRGGGQDQGGGQSQDDQDRRGQGHGKGHD